MAGFLTELVTEVIGEVAGLFTASKLGWFGKIAGKIAASPSVQETVTKKIERLWELMKAVKHWKRNS